MYSKLLCPELLLWIYEGCGVDSTLVQQAYDVAVQGKIDGTATTTIAKNMRGVVAWSDIEPNLLASKNECSNHHVNPAVKANEYRTTGLSYDGYALGDTVTFTIVKDEKSTVEIESVSVAGVELANIGNDTYSFSMPSTDVAITVATIGGGQVKMSLHQVNQAVLVDQVQMIIHLLHQ